MTDAVVPLSITPTPAGLALVGDLDAYTAPRLVAAMSAATAEPLVLDLSAIEFIDSSGLRTLIEAHQQRVANGGSLQISRPSARVASVLRITGVDAYLTVVDAPMP